MQWYYYIAWFAILTQSLFIFYCMRNYRFAFKKIDKPKLYRPPTVLIVPCKGIDATFDKNITSLFNQDYEDYRLWFVVGEQTDPAYERLTELIEKHSTDSKAVDIRLFIAGIGKGCGQKVHNQLHCCKQIKDDIEVIAFADSDICVEKDWLRNLVWPLRKPKYGASSGYRWFIPEKNNLASLVLSILNGKIAQLAGHSRFNLTWGGSMAIRRETFINARVDQVWSNAITDDLTLTWAVKKAGMKVQFVPACLVASYESMTWPQLFEFARRQFLITRNCAPGTWYFGLFSTIYSILGLWAGTGLAIYAAKTGTLHSTLYIAVPVIFLAGQILRAILRQKIASKLLTRDRQRMKPVAIADIMTCWLWTPLMLVFILSSAFGRTMTWRGIKYKLLGPDKTIVINKNN